MSEHRLRQVGAAGAVKAATEPAPELKAAAPAATPIVVIVDDDAGVCDSLSVLLQAHGFATLTYTTGAAFLADGRRRRAGVLIIDHHMPGLNGLDVVAALRREEVLVPVMLITGRIDAGIAERAARIGAVSMLEKPFSTALLLTLISHSLDGRR